jgi:biopolymer transport protein ExbB/TolQ
MDERPGSNLWLFLGFAKVATVTGLAITIIMMIGKFAAIQQTNGGDLRSPAESVGRALLATLIGVVCSISMIFAHVLYKSWRR